MERRRVWVRGIVQGIGFRPFVAGAARRRGLGGCARNEGDGLRIEVEGAGERIDDFLSEVAGRPPAGARIESIHSDAIPPRGGTEFVIEPSDARAGGSTFLPPDLATCEDCLAELFDPTDRRHRYPFISCARCGPRFTAIEALPYDRERTTMAGFELCSACRREYDDPNDRRFHAQTTACAACGPRLRLLDSRGRSVAAPDPLARAVAALADGRIVAVKGLGGFHLACDARNGDAVARLRGRKHRDAKPLAIMVAGLADARASCEVSAGEAALLASPQRPIVLLRRGPAEFADTVAPAHSVLGVMLPYTPLHHLLLRDLGGTPLVMTSGNRSDEPIAYEDADAIRKLEDIADLFLTHDRPIRSRCDDSVVRVVAGMQLTIRRSRGYAPAPIPLPIRCPRPILATGGESKAVFAFGRDGHAILSHHLGDLDDFGSYREYAAAITDYERLLGFRPEIIAHDLHPDYASTRFAAGRKSADAGVRLVAVQHHHAHMAACMAENGLNEPVIGVTFDGSGYGSDGTIWGGEFLVGDYSAFRRAAHLRPVAQPGGDRAVREPWRMAAAHLLDAGLSTELLAARVEPAAIRTVESMVRRRLNAPLTSSAGRLFDAIASLIGLRDRVGYEGQAAVELEALASDTLPVECYPFTIDSASNGGPLQIDTRPLIAAIVRDVRAGTPPAIIARRFHSTLVEIIADACRRIRGQTRLNAVVLGGGVFLNAILLAETMTRLERDSFRVYRHRVVPPGDGGLCLGQLAVAAALESGDHLPSPHP